MVIHQIERIHEYVCYLQGNVQEAELLFKELLIGVTSFFRDPASWDYLRDHAIPELLKRRPVSRELRAWTPGCSTGEEAYSLAIAFQEALESITPRRHCRLQIFATDLDPEAIDRARRGLYPASITADVSSARLARFFTKEDEGYRLTTEIRETVVFAPQNVIMDPPFTKIDILVCRNLLIYLESVLQKTLFPLFHYSLRPDGILFLGSAETIGGFTPLFGCGEEKYRIYYRLGRATQPELNVFPTALIPAAVTASDASTHSIPGVSLQMLADQVILRHYAPPAVLATTDGDVVYISRRTGKYLEPAVGKANLNVFAMARRGLREELGSAFRKAIRERGTSIAEGLTIDTGNGEQTIDLIIQALDEPLELQGMVLIVFRDVPVVHKRDTAHVPTVSKSPSLLEMDQLRHELCSVREENQSAQEELLSANEEFQSTNEELQSTNEELIASKEEMQSMNEELQTVNAELQAKVEELSMAASDMRNLLDSTDIATIFLDAGLRVRRFTSRATKIIKFIPGDVGRPITDLASDLDYPALADDTQEVLRTLVFSEKDIPASGGRWFSVRIMPYRTIDDRIDGVVITLADIPEHRLTANASECGKDGP
jgi:two-component system CheB/CheR fusion protein